MVINPDSVTTVTERYGQVYSCWRPVRRGGGRHAWGFRPDLWLVPKLLMTPAALHRIAFGGEDDSTFFRIGSGLVIAAAFPLALGIAADIYVVFLKISDQAGIAMAAAISSLLVLLGLWFAYPIWQRTFSHTGSC